MGRCRGEVGGREGEEREYIGHVSDKFQCTVIAASMGAPFQTLD